MRLNSSGHSLISLSNFSLAWSCIRVQVTSRLVMLDRALVATQPSVLIIINVFHWLHILPCLSHFSGRSGTGDLSFKLLCLNLAVVGESVGSYVLDWGLRGRVVGSVHNFLYLGLSLGFSIVDYNLLCQQLRVDDRRSLYVERVKLGSWFGFLNNFSLLSWRLRLGIAVIFNAALYSRSLLVGRDGGSMLILFLR